jgi:Flp pilus assembly protein TadD
MVRSNQGFIAKTASGPKLGLLLGTAFASLALTGCAASAPPAQTSFSKAQSALEAGKIDKAIGHAEAAVLAEPRNPAFRAILGAAYLEAGRFNSAATTFGDAIELGDNQPRTILSYALAKTATGDQRAAMNTLVEHDRIVPHTDLGLAVALAGDPERGVQYLVGAIRSGEATAKARQNLAYAYALAGNWRAARVMAAEDVPADQLDARLTDWATNARPDDYQQRVANLLNVSPVYDGGQPQHLALGNFPSQPTLVAEAEEQKVGAPVEVAAAPSESEALAFGIDRAETVAAAESVDPTAIAKAEPQPVPAAAPGAKPAPRFVSNAVVQSVPKKADAGPKSAPTRVAASSQARMAVSSGSAATHLVQLGSFNSRDVAEAKWAEFQRRFPELKGRDNVITEAEVNGRTYFRLAAAGFGARTARSMCATVKSSGRGCFAYAASSPPAGAVKRSDVQVATRTR